MYNIQDIAGIITSIDREIKHPDHLISHLLIDSRKLLFPDNSLFFAFLGKQTDGHNFIDNLYSKGVRSFIIEDGDFDQKAYSDANFLLVPKCINALQELASHHRSKFNIPFIGLTGSNGKTIIKEWIYQLLEHSYNIVRSPGSYNSQIGVPLSVWQVDETTDFAIIEAGISTKGEMTSLSNIINAGIGIFTNLGDAHNSGFKTKEEKLLEKIILFKDCNIIIYDEDEEISSEIIENTFKSKKLIGWSFSNRKAAFYISEIEKINGGSKINYVWNGKGKHFLIPFKDKVSVRMAIFSFLTALVIGAKENDIQKRTNSLSAINMRLEVKDGANNCLLINDSYNADLTSFTQALHFLSIQDESREKILILSDFFQSGINDEKLNEKLAGLINNLTLSKLILVGSRVTKMKTEDLKVEVYLFESTAKLLKEINSLDLKNSVILIKGSRVFEFERIYVKLARRYHSTVLEINLDAMVENILVYRSLLKAETKVMAVIKASGYGAGSVKLARHLEKNNVNYFSVAFVDEGIELRKGGIKTPIMIFNADLYFLQEMYELKLEPVVYSFEYLDQLINNAPPGFGVHIKIDSGLNRFGFQEKDWDKLCHSLGQLSNIKVLSIFSHFSASPTTKYDDFSRHQINVFNRAYEKVCAILRYRPLKHLLNSAGVVKFNDHQFDMVRIGSGFHGIDTSRHINDALQVVHTLKAKVSMIKTVAKGDSIGYERMGITDRVRKIAIIPIGYADGLVRKAGNERFFVWLNGARVPIVGNVNMDMTMIDISNLNNVEIGDEVEIFGPNAPIQDLAKAGDTIFYEILTRISPRVKRIYTSS